METYFFAKEVPSTPIFLANGRKLVFDSIDGITGYTFTIDPGLAGQLYQLIQSGIGGVRVATAQEYEDFVKKKPLSENSRKPWREEITPQEVLRVSAPAENVAAAAKPAPTPQPKLTGPSEPDKPFRPKTSSPRKPKAA